MSKNRSQSNRAIQLLIACILIFFGLVPGTSASASTTVAVSMPRKIVFNPSDSDQPLSSITVSGTASYVQLDIQVTDPDLVPVSQNDRYQLAVANKCAFDSSVTNPATSGTVAVSGDDSTELLMAGSIADLNYALQNLWVYNTQADHCNANGQLGQGVLARQVKIAAIETIPGVWWNSYTKHYYQLATRTTSDDLGQPTDDFGNITDSSRYFVKWSTARADAKSSTITVAGNTYNGYLASITTEPEFKFLNDNVSGNGQDVFPAWVGGTDVENEGTWSWVDGPEALAFGGDTLTRQAQQDPQGRLIDSGPYGSFIMFNGYESDAAYALYARDQYGNTILDSSGYRVVINLDSGGYCNNYFNRADDMNGYEVDYTPYGGRLVCAPWGNAYLLDDFDNTYFSESDSIYQLDEWGNRNLNGYGDFLAIKVGGGDTTPVEVANYRGAQFWGPDNPWNWNFGVCWKRGARGTCNQGQTDTSGAYKSHDYYVHWSNGSLESIGNWDGTGAKPGDGLYSAQPDNAGLGVGDEDALIINWCARTGYDPTKTSARQETLYGNSGYFCTPGWNDLPAGEWYSTSPSSLDSPNHIGTTDYVIEYCGYVNQICEAPVGATSTTRFTVDDVSQPLIVSFEPATAQVTSLQSATLQTETFDSVSQNLCGYCVIGSAIGAFSGNQYTADPGVYGGAGGTGKLYGPVDVVFTPTATQRYFGLWWSAGSAGNYIEFLDNAGNSMLRFDTSDLVNQLGACTGNPYCGNPNITSGFNAPNELYVFVNFRIDGGYSAVRLSGPGFETDNITISESAPARSASETLVTTNVIQNDCSTLTVQDLQLNLTACPQQASATVGQSQTLSPLSVSPLEGYNYPAEATVSAVNVYSGTCSASLASNTSITVTSASAGECVLEYTITNGNQSSSSRITVTISAGGTASFQTPTVLPVDPRATSVWMPQLPVTADSAITMCFVQVADAAGAAMSPNTFQVLLSGSHTGVTSQASGQALLLAGAAADLSSASAAISVSDIASASLTSSGEAYLKVSVVVSAAIDSAACSSSNFAVIRIKPLEINLVTNYLVPLTSR